MPHLALLGELHADSGRLPEGWSAASLTNLQVQWLLFWRRRVEHTRNRTLGEMLGVYWTADSYKKPGNGPARKAKEVFLPLAAILNGDVLYKTLDKVLDTAPAAALAQPPGVTDLTLMPVSKYKDLFERPQTEPLQQPQSVIPPARPIPRDQPVFDLDRIRAEDPELARHLEEDASF